MAIYTTLSSWPKHQGHVMAALRAHSLVHGVLADGTRIDEAWWRETERMEETASRERAAGFGLSIPYNAGAVSDMLMGALEDFLDGPLMLGAWKRATGKRSPQWLLLVPFEFAPDGVPWMEFPAPDGGLFVGNACEFVHRGLIAGNDSWGEEIRANSKAAFEAYQAGALGDGPDVVAKRLKLVVEYTMFNLLRVGWDWRLPVSVTW
jgi:hypothetical protein